MNATKTCPSCRKPLAANAPDGLCAECLAKAALPTGMDPGPDSQPENGRTVFQAPSVEEVSRLFPQLEVLGFIGQGGMGAVYRVRQKELDRIVALKILPPDLGADLAFADRFAREARALAKLNHPGIVTLYEYGRTGGLFFFLMELVDGVNLRQLLLAGRVSPREALAIVPQICDALQYAHDQGIVHRDIKPENILMDRQGRVKVADFGLAKLVGGGDGSTSRPDVELAGASLFTEAGKVMGTPQYMAPEQVEHPREVDHRADIYSLGVVFYQMLTGELPGKQLEPPSRKVQVDVRLDEVVLRALEEEPERRYQQASQVKSHVEAISSAGPSAPAPPLQPEEGIHQAGSMPNGPFRRRMAVLALALSLIGWAAALLSLRVGPNGEIQSNVGWSLLYVFVIPALICGILARQTWPGRAAILLSGAFLLFPLLYPAWGASGLSYWTNQTAEDGVGPRQVVDVAKMPGGPWIGHWPGGGKVELLGLAPHPSHNQSWWRPDGSPLKGGGLFSWSRYVQKSGPHFLVQELAFRFANFPAGASLPEYYFEPNGIWLYGQAGYALGEEAQDLEMLAVSLPKSALSSSQVLHCRVGIALGAWSTVAEDHGQSSYTSISQEGYSWIITFAKATELNGQTAITVTHTVTNREVRVVAIDADGKEHVGQMVGTRRGGPSPTGPIRSDPFTQLTTTFPSLPLVQARFFRLQVRPYEWVEFRNVALQPREHREPSPAAAPITVPPEFQTNLPNGTLVELIGLSRHPSIGHRWWRPNGQALDAVPYLNQTLVFRNATNRDAYELAYRIHRPPNASHWQGNLQVSGNVGLGSFVPQDPSGRPFSDVQAEAILFKSGQTTTEVRIGVALGRWDFVSVTNQEISRRQEDRWIRIGKPRENAGRSMVEMERDLSWDDLATEFVAVDHQGQVHQPTSENVMAVNGDGNANQQKFVYTFERLRLAEVKEFQYRYQPYEWAQFRNVRLSPER